MTQQFTESTDGNGNLAIAAGADPTYTVRVRGVNWRPNVMLVLEAASELEAMQICDADHYYIRGVGEVSWFPDDTTTPAAGSVWQITGIPTGRYKLTGGSSITVLTPSGTVAVSSVTARSGVVSSGNLTIPSPIFGLDEILEFDWESLYIPPSIDGYTHINNAGGVAQWSDLSGHGLHWTQSTAARQPVRSRYGTALALGFDRASEHRMTRTPPSSYAGKTAWTRVFGMRYADATASTLVDNNGTAQFRMYVNLINGTIAVMNGGDTSGSYHGAIGSNAFAFYTMVYDYTQDTEAERCVMYVNTSASPTTQGQYSAMASSLSAKTTEYLGCKNDLTAYLNGHVCFFADFDGAMSGATLASMQQAVDNLLRL